MILYKARRANKAGRGYVSVPEIHVARVATEASIYTTKMNRQHEPAMKPGSIRLHDATGVCHMYAIA